MADLPDVRLADTWTDNDPRGGATFVVVQVCPTGCRAKHGPHAHVCGEDGKRPRTILLERFRPTSRGYLLLVRSGDGAR